MNETVFNSEKGTLTVKRLFDAPLNLVWRAWTEPELLDQWWAPKPWKSETKSMDFKVGGFRLYAMISPEGEKHWGRTDYKSIDKLQNFKGADAFCDEYGVINSSLPVANFTNSFIEIKRQTEVIVTTVYESEDELKKVIEMGMKEGLSMAYQNLDKVLFALIKR